MSEDRELAVHIRTTADNSGAQSAAGAVRGIGDAAKSTAPQLGNAAKGLGELKHAGREAAHAMTGLAEISEGGSRGILGLLRSSQGLIGILRSMGSVAGGPLAIGLGAAAAGIAYLGREAEKNKKAIEEIFAKSAERAEQLKQSYAALEKAGAKSMQSQVAEVDKLGDAFGRLLGAMNAAQQQNARVLEAQTKKDMAQLDRDEQADIGKATTPEERAKVNAKYGARREGVRNRSENIQRENDRMAAGLLRDNANRAIADQRQLVDAARLEAIDAQIEADMAVATAGDVGQKANGSDAHLAALDKAKLATQAATEAQGRYEAVDGKARGIVEQAEQQIKTAENTLKLVGLQEETVKLTRESVDLQRKNSAAGKDARSDAAVGSARAGVEETQGALKAARDQLDRAPGMSSDPRNRGLAETVRSLEESLASRNALLGAVEANARAAAEKDAAMVSALNAQRSDAEQTGAKVESNERQAANARSYAQ